MLTLDAAMARIEAMLGSIADWTAIAAFMPKHRDPDFRRSALASTVVATLELARRGALDLRQDAPFGTDSREGSMSSEAARAIEALLFASDVPLSADDIARRLDSETVADDLLSVRDAYAGRGINLVECGGRWHFQTAPDMAHLLRQTHEAARKLSRAATETLAIIAYHEPVSRADIEAIRGVQISRGTLDVLIEAGWIAPAGRRQVPGRPLTYATTPDFLTNFGLTNRGDLPGIDDLRAAGMLDPISDTPYAGELETEDEDD